MRLRDTQLLPWVHLKAILIKKRENIFQYLTNLFRNEMNEDIKEIFNSTIEATIGKKVPYVITRVENQTMVIDGYIGELWSTLENVLKFRTKYTNMTIDDEREAMRRVGGEIMLNPVILQTKDYDEFGYTLPIAVTWCQLSAKLNSQNRNSMFYVDAWSPSLWTAFAGYLVILTFFSWIINRMSFRMNIQQQVKTTWMKYAKTKETLIEDEPIASHFFNLWGALANQGIYIKPYSHSMRITSLIILVYSYVMLSSYSAILVSHLTTSSPPHELHLEDTKGLLDNQIQSLCISPTGFAIKYFENTENKNGLGSKGKYYAMINRPPCTAGIAKSDIVPIDDYCKERCAVFESKHNTNYMLQVELRSRPANCQIHMFKGRYHYSYISLLTNKRFKFINLINFYFLKFHSNGIIRRFQERFLPTTISFGKQKLNYLEIVHIGHVQYLIILYLGTGILSFIILLFEILIKNKSREDIRKPKIVHWYM